MSIVIICAFWCVVGYLYHKLLGREPPDRQEPYKPDSDLLLTLQRIDEIKVTAERIRQLENILTDIDLIGENAEKGITLTVPSISGSQTEYSFISSKTDTTGFKAATQAELNRLKHELQRQIQQLTATTKTATKATTERIGE